MLFRFIRKCGIGYWSIFFSLEIHEDYAKVRICYVQFCARSMQKYYLLRLENVWQWFKCFQKCPHIYIGHTKSNIDACVSPHIPLLIISNPIAIWEVVASSFASNDFEGFNPNVRAIFMNSSSKLRQFLQTYMIFSDSVLADNIPISKDNPVR